VADFLCFITASKIKKKVLGFEFKKNIKSVFETKRENEKITVIDARETAPLNSTPHMFNSLSDKTKGGLSVAVPGEIKGYWQAHQMFGKLKWSKLFQPAIEM